MDLKFSQHFKSQLDEHCVIVPMRPADYIRLASDGTPAPVDDDIDLSRIQEWSEWPKLELDPETKQVISHEGRHRMTRLQKAGYERVDVVWELLPDPMRGLSLDAALAWKWDGKVPDVADLKPQCEWQIERAIESNAN